MLLNRIFHSQIEVAGIYGGGSDGGAQIRIARARTPYSGKIRRQRDDAVIYDTMKRHRPGSARNFLLVFVLFVAAAGGATAVQQVPAAGTPAKELTDQQFWSLSKDSSEEDGVFRSDNLLSNETSFQYVIPELVRTVKQGRVYLGVGPEQNFTYISAVRPSMAIILHIRHGNLDVHLMYKALFELSRDRADFVSRLFSRKRPNGLTASSTADEIFRAYLTAEGSKELYEENLEAIESHLVKKHGFPLSSGDREGIRWAFGNFYRFGPAISYGSSLSTNVPPAIVGAVGGGGRGSGVTYADLMTSDDGRGQNRSYLASEDNFAFLKDLQNRNLVVPVVGDFGGDRAIRSVARYLKSIDASVSAFYLSNVEQFLVQDGKWNTFCASASTLPLDETSVFIRSGRGAARFGAGGVQNSSMATMLDDLQACAAGVR